MNIQPRPKGLLPDFIVRKSVFILLPLVVFLRGKGLFESKTAWLCMYTRRRE
jgi:hypothetical protein